MMYYVKKSAPPSFLTHANVRADIDALRSDLQNRSSPHRQKHLDLNFSWEKDLSAALRRETRNRCAYCEQTLESRHVVIDHYRPMLGALDSKGRRSENHYTWLAYDWDNLFASCEGCGIAKGAKFPVAGARFPFSFQGKLEGENPLILKPSTEGVHKHFNFYSSGTVDGRTFEGRETISILKLNRPLLVSKRADAARRFLTSLQNSPTLPEITDTEEFQALHWQLLEEHIKGHTFNHDLYPNSATFSFQKEEEYLESLLTDEDKKLPHEERLESAKKQKSFYENFPFISEICIENCFGFVELNIKIPEDAAEKTPWLVLLGENGVGKSSILKAIALALSPKDAVKEFNLSPKEIIHDSATTGTISIIFDSKESVTLSLTKDDMTRHESEHFSPVLLLGYGATRLVSKGESNLPDKDDENARAKNLFDSYEPLLNTWKWLIEIDDDQFDYAARALKDILNLDRDTEFRRQRINGDRQAKLTVHIHNGIHPLERLSEGYRSVISLSCDIMSVMFQKWKTMEDAQGIVLIDELENHLHPTWKMRIVTGLRLAFPRIQFIVSTHEPLCLRGLKNNEVVLLRRSNDEFKKVEAISDLPDLPSMRVDQILTSPYFGLKSTVDPSMQAIFEEYYVLLQRKSDSLSDSEKIRMEELEEETRVFNEPTLMDRDRIIYRAIDKFLAERSEPLPLKVDDFDADTQALIRDIATLLKN